MKISHLLAYSALFFVLLISTRANAQAGTIIEQNNDQTLFNRCLANRDCMFEQWFLTASVGIASGDVTDQDILSAANEAGFDAFDIEIDDTRSAYKINLGVYLAPKWTAEIGYVDLGEVKTAFSAITNQPDEFFAQTNNIHPTSADGYTLAANYTIFSSDRWQTNIKAGVFLWQADYSSLDVFNNLSVNNTSDDEGEDIFYGVSLSYFVSNNFDVQLGLEQYHFDSEKANLLAIGMKYYF